MRLSGPVYPPDKDPKSPTSVPVGTCANGFSSRGEEIRASGGAALPDLVAVAVAAAEPIRPPPAAEPEAEDGGQWRLPTTFSRLGTTSIWARTRPRSPAPSSSGASRPRRPTRGIPSFTALTSPRDPTRHRRSDLPVIVSLELPTSISDVLFAFRGSLRSRTSATPRPPPFRPSSFSLDTLTLLKTRLVGLLLARSRSRCSSHWRRILQCGLFHFQFLFGLISWKILASV